MTKLSFFNGLKEIGGTFVVVETKQAKCMFDFGFGVAGRGDEKIAKREKDYAADYIRLGMLNAADGIYDKYTAEKTGVKAFGEAAKECFFVISHMHIDHMGGLGMLHPDVPVYMSMDSLRLYRKLEEKKDIELCGHKNCVGIPYGESFTVGDITVKVIQIDHDIVGACGFLISTPDGTICYTGDYRFHGFHPAVSKAFAKEVKGCNVLITEGVTVSFSDIDMLTLTPPEEAERTEYTLLAELKELAPAEQGLLVINPYNRNVERVHEIGKAMAEVGRTLVLDCVQAAYVEEFYPEDEFFIYEETCKRTMQPEEKMPADWKIVTREELLEQPEKYVLQLDYADIYELFDIKEVVSRYIHIDGAPLGSYDSSYDKMTALLALLKIHYDFKSLGGHSKPYCIRHMIDKIEPEILIPLHSSRPEQVNSTHIKERCLPEYGDSYLLEKGSFIKA